MKKMRKAFTSLIFPLVGDVTCARRSARKILATPRSAKNGSWKTPIRLTFGYAAARSYQYKTCFQAL